MPSPLSFLYQRLSLLLCILPAFLAMQADTARAQPPPVTDPAQLTRVAGSEQGFVIFQEQCMSCHGRIEVPQAPAPETLRAMPAQRIYEALTTGAMQIHAANLSESDIRFVAEAVSGELLMDAGSGEAANMPNQCAQNLAIELGSASWNGWSPDRSNRRWQPAAAAGLQAGDIPELELLWAFGFPGGSSAFSQPSVVGGRVFVGSDNGYVYSLDADSGCVYWSFRPQASVRNSISVAPVSGYQGVRHAAWFGDLKGNLYALDARTGMLLWQTRADTHLTARMTASPALHEGVLYVPMSSWEEGAARAETYPCCTFRGSVAAYDANTGEQLWKTWTISQTPQPTVTNAVGVQLHTPAGASVWNTPVIDADNRRLYFGTGNGFTYPAAATTDAVMALHMDTGAVLWSYQAQADDAFLVGCGAVESDNCPPELGPDNDIPAALMLVTAKAEKPAIIAVSRTNEILSLSPNGHLNWRTSLDAYGGGVIWGGSADEEYAYYGLSSGGMIALELDDGEVAWFSQIGAGSNGAVVSSIDGVAFVGGISGMLSALNTENGEIVWQFNTARDFNTVNEVSAKGGSISAAGTVIADGKLFATSGYSVIFGQPGNVLLAFARPDSAD